MPQRDISDIAEELTFAVSAERLHEFEREQREQASSANYRKDPYWVMRRKTKALAAFLDVDEATAEKILLKRVDVCITES